MPLTTTTGLSKRERQIVNILYRLGSASVTQVLEAMADPPSYSAVRATLRLLEEKGHIRHREEGKKYVFFPKVAKTRARATALRDVLCTFFDGSVEQTVTSLLDLNQNDLTDDDLERLSRLIDQARKEERNND